MHQLLFCSSSIDLCVFRCGKKFIHSWWFEGYQ